MSTVAIVLSTIIATLAATGIGFITLKAKKAGLEIPWDKIRPILTEVFTEVIEVVKADKMGYGALEHYVVQFVKNKIDESTFFSPIEKALLSEELIRTVIAPRLRELYNKGR